MKKEMNKGFSLVELIIVIAIMVVLVGMLAPQYLRFVNNSKVSTDIANGQELANAFNAAFAEEKVTTSDHPTGNGGDTMSWSGVSIPRWPEGKYSASNCPWDITLSANGVDKITCNGVEVWPNPSAYERFNK